MASTNEFDIARFILSKTGEISAMKLQKLLYYCQAWSMVWDEEKLFDADFQAWANGPVLPSVYDKHRGLFKVGENEFKNGDVSKLTEEQIDTIEKVLDVYGSKTAQWLSNLTHEEAPWIDARKGLSPSDRSNNHITKGEIHSFYSGL